MRVSDPVAVWDVPDPRELALRIRLRAVRMVAPQGFGYLGQALSSAEQVAAVFASARPGVDRIVCSAGHYIIGPFAAAAELARPRPRHWSPRPGAASTPPSDRPQPVSL
jgi:transketolase